MSAGVFGAALAFRVAVVDAEARLRRDVPIDQDQLRSPGPTTLGLAAMEHAPAWADLLWLQIVQDLGQRAPAGFDRVQRWAEIAVDLDPRYFTVYHAAAIHLLVYAHRSDAADSLLERGSQALPDRWELPFLLGYDAYFIRGIADEAARHWSRAAQLPNAPRFLPSLAARARFQSGDESGSIAMLESMISYLDGPAREDAEIRLKILRSEPVLRTYDEACRRFRSERGRVPRSGQELFEQGYVSEKPVELLGGAITLDADCVARSQWIPVREHEARARIGMEGRSARAPSQAAKDTPKETRKETQP